MIDYDSALGLAVKEARKSRGISDSEIASYLGVNLSAYKMRESGDMDFTDHDIEIIAEYLNIHYDDIHDQRKIIMEGGEILPNPDFL